MPKKQAGRPATDQQGILQRLNISFEKLHGYIFSFHVNAIPRRCPLKSSLRNNQRCLEKCEESGFEGKANLADQMATNRVGELVLKAPVPKHESEPKGNKGGPEDG